MSQAGRSRLAEGADVLTLLRLVIAAILVTTTWTRSWSVVALLVTAAWLSDFLDGRLARAAAGSTRLGGWDFSADTLVGAGLVIGLIGAGSIHPVPGIGVLVVFGGLFIAGNVAAAMLLQLTGYLTLLYILWTEMPPGWWAPFVTALLIGVVDWRRLFLISIPAFLRGITGRFEGRRL